MWLLIVAALLAGGLLGSATVRERLLGVGLRLAAPSLPGEVTTGAMEWPQLGHLRLQNLVWTDGPDTLVQVRLLDVQLDTQALRARDVRVDSLQLVVQWVDVPAIEALLSALAAEADTVTEAADPGASSQGWVLRSGSVPGLPSLAVAHWLIKLEAAALTVDASLADLVCRGGLEAGYGRPASAVVEHLQVDLATTVLDSLTGHATVVSLAHLGFGMQLKAAADSLTGGAVTAVMDSLTLHLAANGTPGSSGAAEAWWQATGPVRVRNTGELVRDGESWHGSFASAFELPGAVELKSLLPTGFPHSRFDRIAGSLTLDGRYTHPAAELSLRLDLGPTTWLNRGLLAAHMAADLDSLTANGLPAASVDLDTLELSLLGASLTAAGSLAQGEVALSVRAAIADSQLVAVLAPGDTTTTVAGDLSAQVNGPLVRPTVGLSLQGGLIGQGVRVPRLDLELVADPQGGRVDFSAGGGLDAAGVQLDSLATSVTLARGENDSLTVGGVLAAWRGDERLALGIRAAADSLGRTGRSRVSLDSLVLDVVGERLELAEPVELTIGPEPYELKLTPLVFGGAPGRIMVSGRADSAQVDLSSEVTALLTEAFLNRVLPSPFWSADGGRDFSLSATGSVRGARGSPMVKGSLAARLLPHRAEPSLGLNVEFAVAAADTNGVAAKLAVVVSDSTVLTGHVNLPGGLDQAGHWQLDRQRLGHLRIPPQNLTLQYVNSLMPPEVQVTGDLSVAADVWAPMSGQAPTDSAAVGRVDGHILAPDLHVALPNRSRIDLAVDVQLAGSVTDQTVSGRIEVESGFFRIPELPRNLHPSEGEPMLWSLVTADSLAPLPDSLAVYVMPEQEGPAVGPGGPGALPNLDLEVVLPGNLRLHGYGLNTELAGALKITRGFDDEGRPQPCIQGEIHNVEGQLQFMNRVFDLERTEVNFAGRVPTDPDLDMLLSTTVNGILVRIMVSGRATSPVIELSSEPDLEEQDIMGVLLFGRPLSELDDDQRGGVRGEVNAEQQLRQNLAGLAMVFGTAGLQNRMSSTFGVDMVEVGSGSAGDATLMVGKYLSPKVMLKYHHSLEKSGTYFLTMEYSLSRLFRLVTTYGQGEEDSGLELKWSRRY